MGLISVCVCVEERRLSKVEQNHQSESTHQMILLSDVLLFYICMCGCMCVHVCMYMCMCGHVYVGVCVDDVWV